MKGERKMELVKEERVSGQREGREMNRGDEERTVSEREKGDVKDKAVSVICRELWG